MLEPRVVNQISRALSDYPTPFYIYDAAGIVSSAQRLQDAFAWNSGFRNFFAVKATPNPSILKLVADIGMGLDCSSAAELLLANRINIAGADIMFTANNAPDQEFSQAIELGAIINLDDVGYIDFLTRHNQLPAAVCFRYNPGSQIRGSSIIGHPETAKFGMTERQLIDGAQQLQANNSRLAGLHSMVISNNLDVKLALRIVELVFNIARRLYDETGTELEYINLGGGLGIPYRIEEKPFPLNAFSAGVKQLYDHLLPNQPAIYMECGRYITGPHGYLVSRVRHLKKTYRNYAGLDASMHNLMRPAIYGAYHKLTVLGKEKMRLDHIYDITGSLCENNDKFAIQRTLPKLVVGDVIVIHDAGAHGHAMGFNYNGKLRSAEVLLDTRNSLRLIRRAETLEDHFATLTW